MGNCAKEKVLIFHSIDGFLGDLKLAFNVGNWHVKVEKFHGLDAFFSGEEALKPWTLINFDSFLSSDSLVRISLNHDAWLPF